MGQFLLFLGLCCKQLSFARAAQAFSTIFFFFFASLISHFHAHALTVINRLHVRIRLIVPPLNVRSLKTRTGTVASEDFFCDKKFKKKVL